MISIILFVVLLAALGSGCRSLTTLIGTTPHFFLLSLPMKEPDKMTMLVEFSRYYKMPNIASLNLIRNSGFKSIIYFPLWI